MKTKRIISIGCVIAMTAVLFGCNSSTATSKTPANKSGQYTINVAGKDYDLLGNPREVIGEMVKDDIAVFDSGSMKTFSEEGFYDNDPDKKKSLSQYRDTESKVSILHSGSRDFISARDNSKENMIYYVAYSLRTGSIDFRTSDNLSANSDYAEINSIKDYSPYLGSLNRSIPGQIAVYFDGEVVDLSQYNQSFDEFWSEYDKLEHNPYNYALGINPAMQEAISQNERIQNEEIEKEIPVVNALIDGCKKLYSGEISQLYMVHYACAGYDEDDGIECNVYVFSKEYTEFNERFDQEQ